MSRYIDPTPQYFDGAGDPVCFGKLYFYESEQNILKTTYADQLLTIANTNPVLLDSAGRTPNTFYSGSARVVLKDCDGLQIWERDPVGGENSFADFGEWLDYITYDLNDIVELNGKFYLSKIAGNQGNDPSTTPSSNANWTLINFVGLYNSTTTYAVGDFVNTADGNLWASQTAANLSNNPATDDGTYWLPAIDGSKVPEVIQLQADVTALDTWINKAADFTIVAGESYQIDASGGAVNAAMPATLVEGDFIIVHNESISTSTVLLTNPNFTIKGPAGTIAAGTDLALTAGATAHLVAKSTTILEAV